MFGDVNSEGNAIYPFLQVGAGFAYLVAPQIEPGELAKVLGYSTGAGFA